MRRCLCRRLCPLLPLPLPVVAFAFAFAFAVAVAIAIAIAVAVAFTRCCLCRCLFWSSSLSEAKDPCIRICRCRFSSNPPNTVVILPLSVVEWSKTPRIRICPKPQFRNHAK
jgi:hypothetical protein